MKVILKIVSIAVFVLALSVSFQSQFICYAEDEVVEDETFELSADPRLAEPLESFQKAQEYMEKGAMEFRRRPGQAQKMYEHAEDYFGKARFLYREIGEKEGIDVAHEIAVCNRMDRKAHVKVFSSRRKRKRAGSAF